VARRSYLERALRADIRAFIDGHNENPNSFRWTKSADEILASVFCQTTQQLVTRTLDSYD